MAIDHFTLADFQSALPSSAKSLGLVGGEETFRIPAGAAFIEVRSSIGADGKSASVGEDSIRAWLVNGDGEPLGAKLQKYITRVLGWQGRLRDTLEELYARAIYVGRCPKCGKPRSVWIVKKDGPNKGKLFATCRPCDYGFTWIQGVPIPLVPLYSESDNEPEAKTNEKRTKELLSDSESRGTVGQTLDDGRARVEAVGGQRSEPAPPRYLRFGKADYGTGLQSCVNEQESKVASSADSAGSVSTSVVQVSEGRDSGLLRLQTDDGSVKSDGVQEVLGGLRFGRRVNLEAEPDEPESIVTISQPVQFVERKPNAEQQAVIDLPVNCAARVLAGPGSGKTFLIEHRIKKLLSEGVNPARILVVTLTNTMAASMGQRIVKLNPQMMDYADHICTIHAACNRILKDEFGPRQVVKPWQARKVLEQLAKELWPEGQRPGYAEIDCWIQLAKRNGLSGNEDLRFFADKLGNFHGERLHVARVKFDEYLKANRLTTFADMLYEVDYLLAHDAAFRAKQQGKFTHIIVDEGQDTMEQAMRILTCIAKPENNFLIVSDVDQTLFRWISATPEKNVYGGFTERYPDGETRKLVTNYRSTIEVVEAQKRLIAYNYSDKGGVYDQSYFKELSAREDAEQGRAVSFTMYETADEEARSIASQILADHDKPEDVFIITRTRAQAAWFEGPLSRANIPYLNLNGGSFWSLRHVRNVVNYVRLAHDYNCDEAFKDVYNIATNDFRVPWVDEPYSNHRYLGNAFVEACGGSWKGVNRAVLQKRSWQIGVEDLQGFIYDIQVTLKEDGLVMALQYVIDKCYRKWLMHDEGLVDSDNAEGGKFEDLATMIGIASEYKTPDDFFKFVDGMQKADKAKNDRDWTGKLVILTCHKAKGLERPAVYAPGWCEGIDKTGKPFGLLPHTFSLIAPPQLGVLPMNGKGRIEDELDIAFVMVSRAMSKVVLSGYRVDKRGEMRASRFVKYIMEAS